MKNIGMYDHLGVKCPLDLNSLAECFIEANYGVHQLMSALVRAYHKKYPPGHERHKYIETYNDDFIPHIEKLLEQGVF